MELIPIIYTVLLIVAILAIATIIVSYITFKIKHKLGKIETPTIEKIAQPVIKVESTVRKAVQKITKPLLPPIQHLGKEPVVNTEKNISSALPTSNSTPKKSERSKSSGHSNRIKVVKNIKPLKDKKVDEQVPATLPPKSDTKKDANLKSLGDKIIDKYTDDKDDNMYTLNVKKNENKKKE